MGKKIDKVEQLKIDMPVKIKDWLKEQAKERGISEEEFINEVLADYADRSNEDKVSLKEKEEGSYKETIDDLLEIIRKF